MVTSTVSSAVLLLLPPLPLVVGGVSVCGSYDHTLLLRQSIDAGHELLFRDGFSNQEDGGSRHQ